MAKVTLRCYGKKSGDQYIASCVDLCLAAQADSFEEARMRLHHQIETYISEACNEDREHYDALMSRKAPLSTMVEYHYVKAVCSFQNAIRSITGATRSLFGSFSVFSESMHPHGVKC